MSSAFNKEIARSITQSMGRFVAIAIISLLGAGFYAGLRMAAPDMRIAGDAFFDEANAHDISVVSTLGLDDESLDILRGVEGVGEVEGAHRADAMVRVGEGSFAANIESMPDGVGRLLLDEGRWPANAGECVIGGSVAEKLGVRLGDVIVVEKALGDLEDTFERAAFEVVGFATSPSFISAGQMGATQLGTGSIELYLYVPDDAFAADLPYAVAYLTVPSALAAVWDTDAYSDEVELVKRRVEEAAGHVAAQRRAAVVGDAQGELDDARADYESERADAESELADAADELAGARTQLDSAAADLIAGRADIDDAAAQIEASEEELRAGEDDYAKGAAELEARRAQYERQGAVKLDELKNQRRQVVDGLARIQDGMRVLEARRTQAAEAGDEALLAGIQQQLDELESQEAQLEGQLGQIDSGIEELKEAARALDDAQAELDGARAKLDRGWKELEKGRKRYLDGLQEYESGLAEYLDGEASYASGMADYEAGRAQADEKFAEAEADLDRAQQDIDDIEHPRVYVLDREKNAGAASLSADADGIAQIATFLPFMFFLVAALVSLTSMTRMVEEERLDIGTHKALGYRPARITSKYLVYGALASGVGAAAGIMVLGKLLPWFILVSYTVSYDLPLLSTPLDPVVGAKALGLSCGITLAATWAAAAASLRERPAALMLPRVPKAGKRIFLERIAPLWSRLSFSRKVTARNLLRYKRRFFMAVVGVAGCTALLMVGFGLRDAIGGIVANQYETLVSYDVAVRVDSDDLTEQSESDVRDVLASEAVEAYLPVDDFTMIAEGPADDMRIEVVVPSDAVRLQEFITLRDRVSARTLALSDDAIVLTEKAASELGANVGDTVMLFDENDVGDKEGEGRAFTLGGIAENYLGHFAYLTPAAYERAFGEQPVFDLDYVKLADESVGQSLSDALLAIEGVNTVSFVADQIATYEEMLAVMDKLIVVIALLSAALAFVVLYNLTNININERVREIATLKVLGFTRGEVSAYIFREVFVMSFIGALVGCAGGVPLTFYIAEAAETANMMFGRTIEPMSFALSFVITMAFSAVVAVLMRPKLARVNMVESLKSIE